VVRKSGEIVRDTAGLDGANHRLPGAQGLSRDLVRTIMIDNPRNTNSRLTETPQ
jgi:hypothetical protein